MKCKECTCCELGYFKSKPNKYVCIGVKTPFVIADISKQCIAYPDKREKEEEIVGVELSLSINFNEDDKRDYVDKVMELSEKIADTIEDLGHEFVIITGKPCLKDN